MRDAPTGVFSLLLAHRPEAFDAAGDARVGLTLSGHTHGGQIGYNGKSAFEPLFPDGYLWGAYRRGASRLYTTSGFGNWFPFRLGCPAEAPLVELFAA
jgi:predicted MPP superfamily phosphohydrolase